jgi:hypothetical protein
MVFLEPDRALRKQQFESDKPADRAAARQDFLYWQNDPDLSAIRDAAALLKLPEDEQKAFTQFWGGVEALLKNAAAK